MPFVIWINFGAMPNPKFFPDSQRFCFFRENHYESIGFWPKFSLCFTVLPENTPPTTVAYDVPALIAGFWAHVPM